jgi:LysM repeat protein
VKEKYTVAKNDNLSTIADRKGVKLADLLKANPGFSAKGRDPNSIYPGEHVLIPKTGGWSATGPAKQRPVVTPKQADTAKADSNSAKNQQVAGDGKQVSGTGAPKSASGETAATGPGGAGEAKAPERNFFQKAGAFIAEKAAAAQVVADKTIDETLMGDKTSTNVLTSNNDPVGAAVSHFVSNLVTGTVGLAGKALETVATAYTDEGHAALMKEMKEDFVDGKILPKMAQGGENLLNGTVKLAGEAWAGVTTGTTDERIKSGTETALNVATVGLAAGKLKTLFKGADDVAGAVAKDVKLPTGQGPSGLKGIEGPKPPPAQLRLEHLPPEKPPVHASSVRTEPKGPPKPAVKPGAIDDRVKFGEAGDLKVNRTAAEQAKVNAGQQPRNVREVKYSEGMTKEQFDAANKPKPGVQVRDDRVKFTPNKDGQIHKPGADGNAHATAKAKNEAILNEKAAQGQRDLDAGIKAGVTDNRPTNPFGTDHSAQIQGKPAK